MNSQEIKYHVKESYLCFNHNVAFELVAVLAEPLSANHKMPQGGPAIIHR